MRNRLGRQLSISKMKSMVTIPRGTDIQKLNISVHLAKMCYFQKVFYYHPKCCKKVSILEAEPLRLAKIAPEKRGQGDIGMSPLIVKVYSVVLRVSSGLPETAGQIPIHIDIPLSRLWI